MSFVGLVTQKDKPTGVSLMAKVVTANKKKSAKKVFKVSVKPNALDEFTCCVIDHSTVVDKINSSQDMSQIVEDVNLIYSGINDTTVSYRIIDVSAPYLSTYLAEDGKINGRPKYGEGNASGYIEVTVSKNGKSVTSRVQASVKEITAEEVLGGIPPKVNKLEQAKRLLRKLAETNTLMQSNEIFEIAQEQQISKRTLENAKKELGIRAKKKNQLWYWELGKEERNNVKY